MLVKPLVAVGLLLIARPLGAWLLTRLPDGKLRRILSIRWDA
jgi:NhaP-type Na+/H+ or K+/H+ antiporter